MKRRDLLRHIESHGCLFVCLFVREGQRHTIFENPENGSRVPIPRHREIPNIFARAICSQLGIPIPS